MFDYCGVGVHHQNGIAETNNNTLAYGARVVLLHAKRMWPKVIKAASLLYGIISSSKVTK